MSKDRYFVIDYDRLIGDNLTEQAFVEFAYEKWEEDYDNRNYFEEPDDIESAITFLEKDYSIIVGTYL